MKLHKVVLVVVSIFSLLLSAACGDQDKAAVEKIEAHLKVKYGEEFVVDSIGGGYGTVTTNTLKANVSPKKTPDKMFKVEITKDLDQVWDDYMNILMAEKLDKEATAIASPVFGGDVWVKSHMNSGGISFPDVNLNEKDMGISDYLKTDSNFDIVLDVFVKSEAAVDVNAQAQNIDRLADELIQFELKNVYIDIFYVKASVFNDINNEYQKAEDVIDYFSQVEQSFNNSWIQVEDSQKQQSLDEIKNNFLHQ